MQPGCLITDSEMHLQRDIEDAVHRKTSFKLGKDRAKRNLCEQVDCLIIQRLLYPKRTNDMTLRKGVQNIYTEVARTYELVNHILTFGLDVRWRKKAARIAVQKGGSKWLDVCSGTGEMARYLSSFSAENVEIFAVDFSYPMLKKTADKRGASQLIAVIAEAGFLPFPEGSFDLVTISFATRNLNPKQEVLESYLEEFNRVLKPGGYFLNLETSQPSSKWIRHMFHFYVKKIVKLLGWILSGSKSGYRYLSFTIPRFYTADEFTRILLKKGFSAVESQRLWLGISAIHVAKKGTKCL